MLWPASNSDCDWDNTPRVLELQPIHVYHMEGRTYNIVQYVSPRAKQLRMSSASGTASDMSVATASGERSANAAAVFATKRALAAATSPPGICQKA